MSMPAATSASPTRASTRPTTTPSCLKASHALGFARPTENVTITNCLVSGYDIGSLLDGTYKRTFKLAPDRDGPTGRIKIGTESAGDFKNITISNVVFDRSRGLALESVDGAHIEDIAISNITMRDVSNSPDLHPAGQPHARRRRGRPSARSRRVSISNVVVYDADPRYPFDHHRHSRPRRGGYQAQRHPHLLSRRPDAGSGGQAAGGPGEYVLLPRARGGVPPREPFDTPEREKEYPEPSMFGLLPAYGFFIRHAKGIELNNVEVGFMQEDRRPAFVLDDVSGVDFHHVKAQKAADVPTIVLKNVEDFTARGCTPLPDTKIPKADRREM